MTFLRKELRKHANKDKAKLLQGFFKTGKGEYGEGDVFLGVMVPNTRKIVNKFYKEATMNDVKSLLQTNVHEERLLALLILVKKYNTTNHKKIIYNFYMKNTKYINNWDLVDLSAHEIVGRYLLSVIDSHEKLKLRAGKIFVNSTQKVLETLAKSKNIWERRIAILATFRFIKENRFDESLKLAEMLLKDKHDLIHKATGWMLREIGNRNQTTEERFLKKYYKKMPRTMLRYAIEKFPEQKRKAYLNGTVYNKTNS